MIDLFFIVGFSRDLSGSGCVPFPKKGTMAEVASAQVLSIIMLVGFSVVSSSVLIVPVLVDDTLCIVRLDALNPSGEDIGLFQLSALAAFSLQYLFNRFYGFQEISSGGGRGSSESANFSDISVRYLSSLDSGLMVDLSIARGEDGSPCCCHRALRV